MNTEIIMHYENGEGYDVTITIDHEDNFYRVEVVISGDIVFCDVVREKEKESLIDKYIE
jgi:hypothetical protein